MPTGVPRNERGLLVEVDAFGELRRGGLELKFRARTLQGKVGRAVASIIRKSVRKGVTPDGRALPRGEDGKRAFRDSGELIRSIKYAKGRVSATGSRSDSRLSNAGLMGVLVYGLHRDKNRGQRGVSPFDPDSPAVGREVSKAADKEMRKQVSTGKAKLVTAGRARRPGRPRFTRRPNR